MEKKELTEAEIASAEAATIAHLTSSAMQVKRDEAKQEHVAEQAALQALTVASVAARDLPRPPTVPPPKVQDIMRAEREIGEFEAGYWAGVASATQKRSVRTVAAEIRKGVLMSGPASKRRKANQGPAQPAAQPPKHLVARAIGADEEEEVTEMETVRTAAARRPIKAWINAARQEVRVKHEHPGGGPVPPPGAPPWWNAPQEEEAPPAPVKRYVSVMAKKELAY